MFRKWSPQEVKGLFSNPLLFLLGVEPSEPPRFETHVSKKPRISWWMTERINWPPNLGLHIEFLLQKLVSYQHIVDHVLIMWGRVASSCILQPPLANSNLPSEISNLTFSFTSSVYLVYHIVKNFISTDVGEFTRRIFHQLLHHCRQNEVDLCVLNPLIGSRVTLVDSLEPPNIIMGMSDKMDIKLLMLPMLVFPLYSYSRMLLLVSSLILLVSPVLVSLHQGEKQNGLK